MKWFKCEWCRKKVTKKYHNCTDNSLRFHYEGGIMYLNREAALKNGLKIFNDAFRGKLVK